MGLEDHFKLDFPYGRSVELKLQPSWEYIGQISLTELEYEDGEIISVDVFEGPDAVGMFKDLKASYLEEVIMDYREILENQEK